MLCGTVMGYEVVYGATELVRQAAGFGQAVCPGCIHTRFAAGECRLPAAAHIAPSSPPRYIQTRARAAPAA